MKTLFRLRGEEKVGYLSQEKNEEEKMTPSKHWLFISGWRGEYDVVYRLRKWREKTSHFVITLPFAYPSTPGDYQTPPSPFRTLFVTKTAVYFSRRKCPRRDVQRNSFDLLVWLKPQLS
ncbi:hypothetical protein NPIL_410611 [Nephila pilipes]|uniref:Uncharacterized protein n=1 Tax=Nephila pilipes TaxID=299642 RepID=A0A8X6QWF3_NEPPI|nr:hypothetical protein NPIL_410611 [Nephila pilipes]